MGRKNRKLLGTERVVVPLLMRIDPDLRSRVRQLAFERETSINEQLETALMRYLDQERPKAS